MSSSSKKYDVFISFRGEDTRFTFIDHLRHALHRENINTYSDEDIKHLKRGDDISTALAKAIQDSHISIVVFSANYAFSSWCLKELCEILKCRKNHGQVVIPVFYNADPSNVRKQIGSYARAFEVHEERFGNESSQWRAALTEAANISGWDVATYQYEYQIIQNIVNDVWEKMSQLYPNELKGLAEIDENSEYIESLLNEFPRIGIWGMGGIGKTTIARQMFAKHFAQYDSVCFLENVREQSEKLGLTYVGCKLFSELLKIKITSSDDLRPTFIRRNLGGRKVFIVLDDVNDDAELEYLCGELSDLGPDSRLIVTTRDKHILSKKVDKIYEVKKWEDAESLELFSLGAFEQSSPKEGYEHLSKRAVEYAGGVPLALKVLGSHFRDRNAKFWESQLDYLENKEEALDKIQKVLQVSYNGLTNLQQAIFLDIAFFFKGEDKNFITRILDGCDFNATCGIEILEDKALITISNSKMIQMHDLLQKMALDIVRAKSNLPGERSRLRSIKEVCDVLKNNKGTAAVEGITLDLSLIVDLHLHGDTFNMMTNLRFLRLYVPLGETRSGTVHHPGFHKKWSDNLRYLEWNGYPSKSLPPKFCAEFLVEIHMPYSHIKELWQGKQDLKHLEKIDLRECKQLMELPDLSKALKLKWVYLSGCQSLCAVHPSLLSIDTLETLILDRCTKLTSLISEKHLNCLQKLSFDDCSSLEEFSVSSDSIERLDFSKTGVKKLHSSICHMSKLEWLKLNGLRLQNLPNELSRLISIRGVKLYVLCNGLFPLKLQHLRDCCKLFEIPDNIRSSLYELRLDGSSVENLPTSIKLLENLEILSLENCRKLGSLSELSQLITELYAISCTSLVRVSNLETFSVYMEGKERHISFKNGMKLSRHSLLRIMEDAQITMKRAALHNVFVKIFSVDTHNYNYNTVGVHLPGSSVPKLFTYRTTESCVAIELPGPYQYSHLIGFIYSVVLSPSRVMGQRDPKIQCFQDGRKVGNATTWHAIREFDSDHVFVWYDPFHCDSILSCRGKNKLFKFCVTTDGGESEGLTHVKEFGVDPIYVSDSELHSSEREAATLKWELECRGIRSQIQNQEQNSSDCILESDTQMVGSDSAEEGNGRNDHYSECIKSTCKEANTGVERCRGQIFITDSTNAVDFIRRLCNLPPLQALGLDKLWCFIMIGHPLRSLPSAIRATLLVEIRMPHNNIKELWQGIQELHNFKRFELSECKQLVRLPDLSKTSRLEWVDLSGCESLCCLPDLTMAPRLQWVDIYGCKRVHPLIMEEGVELESGRSTTLTSIETPDKEESCGMRNQIQNQRWDSSEQSSSDSINESDLEMVKADSGEEGNERKDHYSEGIKSTRKETKTVHGQISITESINVKNKGNEGMTTESDAGLQTPVVSVDEENALKDKSSENNCGLADNVEEISHKKENPNLQGGGQATVPDTNDLNIKEPYNKEKENEAMDLGKPEGEDEDPFDELESILFGSPKSLAKAVCSTSDVAMREALYSLECLLENPLESFLGDMELQRQLHTSLECIQQASEEKVSPNIAKLVESMTSSIDDLFKDFLWTLKVSKDHTSCLQTKEELKWRTRDAKKQKELVEKEKSQYEDKTKCLDEEAKKLDEKIRLLVEQKKTVELEKSKLKESMERCDGERKKLEDKAKNMITESIELMSAIEVSKSSYAAALSKKRKLNDKWEDFRTAFADNYESS